LLRLSPLFYARQMGAMAYSLLFCLLLAHLGLGEVGASLDPPGRPDSPRERTPRGKQHGQQLPRASAPDPSIPWSRSTDGTILAQKLAEEVPVDVASYLYTGDFHQLKRANCSGRYELAGLPGKSPSLASSHPSLHGALDTLTHATNFLNMMLQSNKSREQTVQDDLQWYQALVRSLLEGEPSISRAAITFSTESLSTPAPQVFLQATREESRILLQDLSSSAHHLANATLETEWFHGLRRKWRPHLHRRGSNQGPRGLGHSWRRRDGLGGDRSHVKWSPPYLECENGSYKPGWLVTLSAAFYGLQPNLVPEFRGVMKVDISLQKVDIDQCSSDGWFSGTHKCHLNNSEEGVQITIFQEAQRMCQKKPTSACPAEKAAPSVLMIVHALSRRINTCGSLLSLSKPCVCCWTLSACWWSTIFAKQRASGHLGSSCWKQYCLVLCSYTFRSLFCTLSQVHFVVFS
ncbi:G protein-coupled receptor 158, isoform CRA_b, partial [Mus musculus]